MMFWRRLAFLLPWRRRAAERDMQEELRSLAEMARPGELGNLTLVAEDARAQWGWTRLEQTGQDVRYAIRSLGKSPGFTATAVVSLAIGIGANTALFTLINTLMWKQLPVSDPERLHVLLQHDRTNVYNGFTFQQYRTLRQAGGVMELAAYSRTPMNVAIQGSIQPTSEGQLVSGNYFQVLGVRAQHGRLLEPDDDRLPMGIPVAVLSDRFWTSRFARAPEVIGTQIALSGVSFTIVGIAPRDFFGVEVGAAPDLFVPLTTQPVVMPTTHNLLVDEPNLFSLWLRIVGRVKPDVPSAEAIGRLDALAQDPDWQPPHKFTGERQTVRLAMGSAATGLSDLRKQFSRPLFVVMALVAIVLVVACANTGNLMLARSAARRSEFSLRIALGAGRSRLMRQILLEGLVLSGTAGVCGVMLAYWVTPALVAYASAGRSALALDLSPDLRVLAFTLGVCMLTGLLFGSVPAFRASRSDALLGVRQDLSRNHALGERGPGKALIVSQVALSLVLLVGAGLFVRTLQSLNRTDTDVDTSRVLIVRVEPRGSGLRGAAGVTPRLDRIYRGLLADVQAIPGVTAASLARTSPLTPISFWFRLATPAGGEPRAVPDLMIYPGYFATMGIPILQGRDFVESDLHPNSASVAIVNDAFVRTFLNGTPPLGLHPYLTEAARRPDAPGSVPGEPLNIIGVVSDTRYPSLREKPEPRIYQTFLQTTTGFGQMVLHVRVAGEIDGIARRVRERVQAIDLDVPTYQLHTLADEVNAALVRERLVATLSGAFGLVAAALIAIGLYGMMAFNVSRRTAEIGIRVVLGARRTDVRWMIVRQSLFVVGCGISLGLPAAWLAGRLVTNQISDMLFEVAPTDPLTMGAAAVLLVVIAISAGVLPGQRAARIDPVIALRRE